MTDETKTQAVSVAPVVDRQVVAELVKQAQADGVAISGEGGPTQQSTVGVSVIGGRAGGGRF